MYTTTMTLARWGFNQHNFTSHNSTEAVAIALPAVVQTRIKCGQWWYFSHATNRGEIPHRLSKTDLLTPCTMLGNSLCTCCGHGCTQKALTGSICSTPSFSHRRGALSKQRKTLTDPKEDALLSSSCVSQMCTPAGCDYSTAQNWWVCAYSDRRWKAVIPCSRCNMNAEKRKRKDHQVLIWLGSPPLANWTVPVQILGKVSIFLLRFEWTYQKRLRNGVRGPWETWGITEPIMPLRAFHGLWSENEQGQRPPISPDVEHYQSHPC